MATMIYAGKYVFGEDIPLGKYNLKVISGNGSLTIRYGQTEDDEDCMEFGTGPECVHEYRNLSLPQGRYFALEDNLQVEISRSKMLEID